jgi:hypothetical protein
MKNRLKWENLAVIKVARLMGKSCDWNEVIGGRGKGGELKGLGLRVRLSRAGVRFDSIAGWI